MSDSVEKRVDYEVGGLGGFDAGEVVGRAVDQVIEHRAGPAGWQVRSQEALVDRSLYEPVEAPALFLAAGVRGGGGPPHPPGVLGPIPGCPGGALPPTGQGPGAPGPPLPRPVAEPPPRREAWPGKPRDRHPP